MGGDELREMLVLDIDETITSPNCKTRKCQLKHEKLVLHLLEYCENENIDVSINTARPAKSYHGISKKIREKIKSKPYCYRPPGSGSVPGYKNKCMIQLSGKRRRRNVTLMDDRLDNCKAVKEHGFNAIHVSSKGLGITEKNVKEFKRIRDNQSLA